jgi:aconitate hydratase
MAPAHWHTAARTPADLVQAVYQRQDGLLGDLRRRTRRPLTLAEKILYTHLRDPDQAPRRGRDYGAFDPDRLAMPDSSAQMALLQFMTTGLPRVGLPSTIHCDHLISAVQGWQSDLAAATDDHGEIYRFLEEAAARYGLGYWKPGSGIIHQVVLENYAFPGGMLIGCDSHTPNAGGMGMIAVGVGGADAVDAMVSMPVSLRMPKLIGVRLRGALSGWTAAKDIILKVASMLSVKGGTGCIVEYFGPGAESISATGKATICNMGAEIGATTSLFNFDDAMARYLRATGREEVADLAQARTADLRSDPETGETPEEFYDRVVDIDLDELEPLLVGPSTPDLARPVSDVGAEAREKGYPLELSYALIGSCTNSSYEDFGRAAHIARQASDAGLKARTPLLVTPGSESVRRTMERDGLMGDLEAIGATVLANACGPCIGQWKREDDQAGSTNSIITSFNRNFPRRNDGFEETLAFIGSPELVVAVSLAGRLDFDPLQDTLEGGLRLEPPSASDLPTGQWISSDEGFVPPPEDATGVAVRIDPDSTRIAPLEAFEPVPATAYRSMPVLVKVAGKCTTDHISPAGPWLRFRGHLDRMGDNTLLGAKNAFSGRTGTTLDQLVGEERPVPEVARHYKAEHVAWVVVGDENYGEGSSREHAAMQVRHLGGLVVLARSFARIHETNLKKQGVLALTFTDPDDYERVRVDDRIDILHIDALAPEAAVTVRLRHADGGQEDLETHHSMDAEQITWLRAGSAMNVIRQQAKGGAR